MSLEKDKALESAISHIERTYGKGAVMRLGSSTRDLSVPTIPTGAVGLDIALGVGGIPRGRITEIFGQEASGKTTLGLSIIAQAQRAGGTAAFIDAENALDPVYASNLGINLDELLVAQPDTGEQALEIADALVRSGAIDTFVLDSVAALVPRAELEGEMGEPHVGLQARLMSQALRKLSGSVRRSNTAAIFINQMREKIGVMFGNPETTPGGRALKFWASVRLDVRRVDSIKDGSEIVGSRVRIRVVKNKLAPPFRQAELEIIYGKGISASASLLDVASDLNIISKTGTWYSLGDERLGQGRRAAQEFLEAHPAAWEKAHNLVMEKVGISPSGPASAPPALEEEE